VLESAPCGEATSDQRCIASRDSTWDPRGRTIRENARVCHVTAHLNGIEDPSIVRVLREFLYARLKLSIFQAIAPACRRAASGNSSIAPRRFLEFVAVNNAPAIWRTSIRLYSTPTGTI